MSNSMTRVSRAAFVKAALALLGGAAAALTVAPARAEVKGDPPEATMKNLLEATKNRSYDAFMADADDVFRAEVSKQNFDGVCGQVSGRLRQGYRTVYLGKLKQAGGMAYVWRVEFKDGQDELLMRLDIRQGKVAGAMLN
jgi:hypothetical protein